jgi:hypothetical protein
MSMTKNFSGSVFSHIKKKHYEWLYILLVLAFMAWGRWDSMLYPLPLNPDEVQAAANALRIKEYGISWDAVDGNTVGPLNSLILGWPFFFGDDVTLSTVRLTALVLLSIIFVFTYLSLQIISGKFFAIVFSAPLALFYGLTRNPDFVHYNSELLSMSLLVLATWISIKIAIQKTVNQPGLFQVIFLGLAVGAVPFAKLQATPIAFCVGVYSLFLLLRFAKQERKTLITGNLIGIVIPALMLLAPLVATGDFHHFYYSYIAWGVAYIKNPLSPLGLQSLVTTDPAFKSLVYFSFTLCLVFFATRLFFIRNNRSSIFMIRYAAILLCATLFAIVRPGNLFPHYLMFLPPFVLLFTSSLGSTSHIDKSHKAINGVICTIVLFIFMAPVFIDGFEDESFHFYAYKTSEKSTFHWKHPDLFTWLSPKSTDRLFVWGRMPQWYIWAGLAPATRESITYNQVVDSTLVKYFRGRLIDDFERSPPAYVVDAVARKSFDPNDVETHAIASFPELSAIVARDYVWLGHIDRQNASCPNIYARKDRATQLRERLVDFKSIMASAERSGLYSIKNVDDYSVTEDSCIDYWLLPNGQLGHLNIEFNVEERVKKVLILNTKEGSIFYRGTDRLKLTLFNKKNSVTSRELKLKRHPEWTEAVFNNAIKADSLIIEILSFEDNGAGLNEIKVIREFP